VVICNLNLGVDACNLGDQALSLEHYISALNRAASLGLLPLALAALLEISKIMIDRKEFHRAASALLFIKENERSFFLEGETMEFDSLLSDTLNRLSEEDVQILRVKVTSITLKEIGTEDFSLPPFHSSTIST